MNTGYTGNIWKYSISYCSVLSRFNYTGNTLCNIHIHFQNQEYICFDFFCRVCWIVKFFVSKQYLFSVTLKLVKTKIWKSCQTRSILRDTNETQLTKES